ncbi:MAG: hypothetical protein GX102_04435 [Porphyromonadaceae bacterium]|jgi:4-amino-4-deoxychorismate lyase|nr:hypothetical protein [Porphyromonadaceae bacterium]
MKLSFIESIKYKNGEFFNLCYHQARMDKTLANFELKKINLQNELEKVTLPDDKGLFKCRIIYGKKVESIEFSPYTILNKKKVGIVAADDIDYSFKFKDRKALEDLKITSGLDDVIIIKNGVVTDALFSNLVFESTEGLFTPSSYLLPGTKRQFLLDSNKIKEKQILHSDIYSYQKVHFINAMIDLEDNVNFEIGDLV